MIEFNRVHMALSLMFVIIGTTAVHASTFDCRDISPTAGGHQDVPSVDVVMDSVEIEE